MSIMAVCMPSSPFNGASTQGPLKWMKVTKQPWWIILLYHDFHHQYYPRQWFSLCLTLHSCYEDRTYKAVDTCQGLRMMLKGEDQLRLLHAKGPGIDWYEASVHSAWDGFMDDEYSNSNLLLINLDVFWESQKQGFGSQGVNIWMKYKTTWF